jgi:branched-subunit amino acid transport protein AzlD
VGNIFGLALLAMFNPSLVAAVTVMLLLPDPKKLMFGYLLGAYLASMTIGMLIVFSFHDSAGAEAAHNTISPAADLVLGGVLLIVGLVLRSERGERLKESRRTRKAAKGKKESMPERMLGKGSAKIAFVVGVILTFPGVSYLTALHRIDELDAATIPTALTVIGFCLIMTLLIEVPVLGFQLAPERTAATVVRIRGWLAENGGRVGANVAIVLGAILVARGLLTLHS